jgi:hypothetical protein
MTVCIINANQPEHSIPTPGFAHAANVAKIDLFEKGKGARDTGARLARFSKHFSFSKNIDHRLIATLNNRP